MRDYKKWFLGATGLGILLVLGMIFIHPYFLKREKTIYYFYDEVCAGCDKQGEFLDLFYERLSGVDLPENVHINCYNIFTDGEALWESLCDDLNISEQNRELPMVIAGDNFVTGEDNIYNHLRHLTCTLYEVPDTGTIWYYFRPDCKDCIRIAELLEAHFKDNSNLSIIRIDTTDPEPKEAFKEKLQRFGVPEEEWQVPFLDNGKDYLSGDDAIEAGISEFLQ